MSKTDAADGFLLKWWERVIAVDQYHRRAAIAQWLLFAFSLFSLSLLLGLLLVDRLLCSLMRREHFCLRYDGDDGLSEFVLDVHHLLVVCWRYFIARFIRKIVLFITLIRFWDIVRAYTRTTEAVTIVAHLHRDHAVGLHHIGVSCRQDYASIHYSWLARNLDPVTIFDHFVSDSNNASQDALAITVVKVVVERWYRLA